MELNEALVRIDEIHRRMARATVFRGYRAATTAWTGAMAAAAGVAQSIILPDPTVAIHAYLALWCGAAALCLAIVAVEWRMRRLWSQSALDRALTTAALEQVLPAVVAGALLTGVLLLAAPETLWMLPGLWQILFSLGIFASAHCLPRAIFAVAGFYLIAGLASLALARVGWAFSPWLMAVPFALGQGLAALILHQALERPSAEMGPWTEAADGHA